MKSVPGARLRQMAVVLTMFLGLPATIWAAPARQFTDPSTTTATPTPIEISPPLFAPASSPVPSFASVQQAGAVTVGVVTFAQTKGGTPDVRFPFGPKLLNAGLDYTGAQSGVPIRWVLRFQESDINWGDVLPTSSSGHADVTLERQDHDYLFIGEFELALYDGARELTRTKFEIYDPDSSSKSASSSAVASVAADNSSSDSSDNSSSADNSSDSSDNASTDNSSDSSDNASVDNSSDSSDNASVDNSSDSSDNASVDNSNDSSDNSNSGDNVS